MFVLSACELFASSIERYNMSCLLYISMLQFLFSATEAAKKNGLNRWAEIRTDEM